MRAIGPVKVVRDLEGAFAEAFEDIGWISGVRGADTLQQLAGIRGSSRRTIAGRKAGLGPWGYSSSQCGRQTKTR